jgi:DNA-binding PadR family transcriptional regulator
MFEMSGSYAIGSPWLWLAQRCTAVGNRKADDWFAAMTGPRGHRSGHQSASWGMSGGQPSFGPPWASGGPGWRTPKARRGDVRAAILSVVADRSMNGYQIIQEIAERSGGVWKPSPGSVYPTLQQLEDEGLVYVQEDAGRRSFALTDDGQTYVAEHPDELASPWEVMGQHSDDEAGFKPLVGQVAAAMWQIMAVGSRDQQAKGREALAELRRKLHVILAEGDDAGEQS